MRKKNYAMTAESGTSTGGGAKSGWQLQVM